MGEREKQLTLIAELYYMQGMNQKEIAGMLGISRPSISRFLEEAKQRKLVTIRINSEIEQEYALAKEMKERFGLRYCCVVKNTSYAQNSLRKCAQAAADFLHRILDDNMILGVCIGPSVTTFADCLEEKPYCNVQVVQLTGCLCTGNPREDGVEIAISIARRLGAVYTSIYAPLYVGSKLVQEYFMREKQVAVAMKKIRSADIVLMGIGTVSRSSSVFRNNHITEKDLEDLVAGGCKAQLMGRMVREDGQEMMVKDKYVIAPPLEELKNVNWTVGIGASAAKAEAVKVAVTNKYINTLFVDEELARAVMKA